MCDRSDSHTAVRGCSRIQKCYSHRVRWVIAGRGKKEKSDQSRERTSSAYRPTPRISPDAGPRPCTCAGLGGPGKHRPLGARGERRHAAGATRMNRTRSAQSQLRVCWHPTHNKYNKHSQASLPLPAALRNQRPWRRLPETVRPTTEHPRWSFRGRYAPCPPRKLT